MRFKDVFSIIGPAMVGPSSSHTAGAARIGRVARQLFGDRTPASADITFYGSFAETYQGHGTDLAITAGLLGYDTDNERIPDAFEDAESRGMVVHFHRANNPAFHPNTVKLVLKLQDERLGMIGSSIGGGNIEIINVDDFDVKFTGIYATLVIYHRDRPGLIADITQRLRQAEANIVSMDVDRKGRNAEAMTVIELDGSVTDDCIDDVRSVESVREIRIVDLAEGRKR